MGAINNSSDDLLLRELTFQIKTKSDGVVYRIMSPKDNNALLVFTPDNKSKRYLE